MAASGMTGGRKVTIVMYHYVRDLRHSRYPEIKGLSLERFRRQLDHIQAHYTPITMEQLLGAVQSRDKRLPPDPILLTFDDGYIDHFTNVFPMLAARGMQGSFFPPAQAVVEHRVLDVNKIHFVLASARDPGQLLDRVFASLDEFRSSYDLGTRESYTSGMQETHRYDVPEVTLLKRLLQRELPEAVRATLAQRLFAEFVSEDEAAFAGELYMSVDQIACLRREGMHVGSHTYSHPWLDRLAPAAQAVEIDRSLEFLRELGVPRDDWTMCYPYGGFDEPLLTLLRARHCRLGLSVEARVADLDADDRLTLPRVDTNDLPS